MPTLVNDVHSRLNETEVVEVLAPSSASEVARHVREARSRRLALVASGARHAMGGQQFRSGGLLLDMRTMKRVVQLERGPRPAADRGGGGMA